MPCISLSYPHPTKRLVGVMPRCCMARRAVQWYLLNSKHTSSICHLPRILSNARLITQAAESGFPVVLDSDRADLHMQGCQSVMCVLHSYHDMIKGITHISAAVRLHSITFQTRECGNLSMNAGVEVIELALRPCKSIHRPGVHKSHETQCRYLDSHCRDHMQAEQAVSHMQLCCKPRPLT